MNQECIRIELTERRCGCLVIGGVCGRVLSYPAGLICNILKVKVSELEAFTGEELANLEVPEAGATLADYLNYHHADNAHVVCKGVVIE